MARLARHLRLLVPAVIVALAVASGAYGASNVTLSGGVATFTAGAGEVNSLTVSVASPNVVFEGVQTITESSPSCASLTTTIVTCTDSAVTSIVVDLRDQNDTLAVESTGDNPITSADTGDGDDAIVLGTSSTPILVEAITSAVSLEGGTGADSLTVRDTGDSSDDILTISSTAIGAGTFDSFFGGGGSATHVNVESISINAGGGDSSVSILGTSAGTTTTFDAGPGNDVIVVSSTGTAATGDLDGVLGPSRSSAEPAATRCRSPTPTPAPATSRRSVRPRSTAWPRSRSRTRRLAPGLAASRYAAPIATTRSRSPPPRLARSPTSARSGGRHNSDLL